ncbi:MAG: hypothetical protein WBV51_06450 [Pseudolabrys sp.]
MLRVIVSSSLVFLSGLFQDKHFAVTWIREKTDAATIMFLYLRCDRAVFFHSPLKAPLVQMSVTAQLTEFAVASGTEFRFPCWSNRIQFKQRSSAMNRAENRAEQYRALAEDVCNRASREPNPIVKAEWENLAKTYVRLARQADDSRNTGPTYDPIQDMLERARN